jgi:GDP-D-mannose 3', 5'-epimerase
MVSINQLFDMISKIAGKKAAKRHDLSKPQGVRGRNSDNTRFCANWAGSLPCRVGKGLAITYKWIENEVKKKEVGELAEVAGD